MGEKSHPSWDLNPKLSRPKCSHYADSASLAQIKTTIPVKNGLFFFKSTLHSGLPPYRLTMCKDFCKVYIFQKYTTINLCFSLPLKFLTGHSFSNTNTVKPGYNNTGLYDTLPVASDILWYQVIHHC